MNKFEQIEKIFRDFFAKMGLNVEASAKEMEDSLHINIKPDDEKITPLLIGYKGENLIAFQHMLRMLVRRKIGEKQRIILDIGEYRQRQINALQEMAKNLAEKVKRTQRVELLRPMSAYERRIVHLAVSKISGLSTQSVGEEPNKRVMIKSEVNSE